MENIKTAKISGWALLLMALIAGYSLGYAYPILYNSENASSSKSIMLQNIELYHGMLIGILLILILDLIVSFSLYEFFKKDHAKISFVACSLRIIYTIIFAIAAFYLIKNINIEEISNDFINYNFKNFQFIWSIGLILFGVHLLLIGVLMKLHKKIPKILWILTLIGGVSYILVHLIKIMFFNLEYVYYLEMILAIPMALGELGLAIWLIVKGGKSQVNYLYK